VESLVDAPHEKAQRRERWKANAVRVSDLCQLPSIDREMEAMSDAKLSSKECVLEIVKEGDRWALRLPRDGADAWVLAYSPVPITVRHAHEPSVSLNESGVRQLLGWLSVDIPELNSVEVPRLMDSWEKFNERAGLTKEAGQ
jgi:hypothetical protein